MYRPTINVDKSSLSLKNDNFYHFMVDYLDSYKRFLSRIFNLGQEEKTIKDEKGRPVRDGSGKILTKKIDRLSFIYATPERVYQRLAIEWNDTENRTLELPVLYYYMDGFNRKNDMSQTPAIRFRDMYTGKSVIRPMWFEINFNHEALFHNSVEYDAFVYQFYSVFAPDTWIESTLELDSPTFTLKTENDIFHFENDYTFEISGKYRTYVNLPIKTFNETIVIPAGDYHVSTFTELFNSKVDTLYSDKSLDFYAFQVKNPLGKYVAQIKSNPYDVKESTLKINNGTTEIYNKTLYRQKEKFRNYCKFTQEPTMQYNTSYYSNNRYIQTNFSTKLLVILPYTDVYESPFTSNIQITTDLD